MKTWRDIVFVNIGLWVPPLLWATSLQLGQILPYVDCTTRSHGSAATAFSAMTLAAFGGGLSWHSALRLPQVSVTRRFLAPLATLSAAVFVFALALQAGATLVLSGCER